MGLQQSRDVPQQITCCKTVLSYYIVHYIPLMLLLGVVCHACTGPYQAQSVFHIWSLHILPKMWWLSGRKNMYPDLVRTWFQNKMDWHILRSTGQKNCCHINVSYLTCFLRACAILNKQVVKVIWQQAASPPHTDGSEVIARLRQCAPHLIRASLGPTESKSKRAFLSVQPFLHSSQQLYFTMDRPFLPQNCPFLWDLDLPHLIYSSLGHPSTHPNGILIGSVVFAGLTAVRDRQTTLLGR